MGLERPCSLARIDELLRLLRTSKRAYERAYDKARRKELRDLYGVLASTRITLINALEDHCRTMQPREAPVPVRGPRRWDRVWREIRDPSWFLGTDAQLKSVYRAERRLLSTYDRHLLKQDLPEPLADLLSRQRVQVVENVENITLFLQDGLSFADH